MLMTLRQCARRALSKDIRRRCLTTAQMLERIGVSPQDPTATELSREQFGHFDAEDRTLLALSLMVRHMCAPEHSPGVAELPRILRDEHALRTLFERAVGGFYRHHLGPQGYSVRAEDRSWPAIGDSKDLTFLPRLKADVVIRGHGHQVVVECKFAPIFVQHHGKTIIKPEYTRQIFSYASIFRGSFDGDTRAVLLGALVEGSTGRDVEFTIEGIPFAVRQIDLSEPPTCIREALNAALDWAIASTGSESAEAAAR